MFEVNTWMMIGVVVGIVLAIIINIWLSIYLYKQRYEKNLLTGTIELIKRLDRIEENMDGGNMQEENKKLAKYLGKKIDGLKEDLLSELQDIRDSLEVLESAVVEGDESEAVVEDDDGISDGTFDDVEDEVVEGADSEDDAEEEDEKEEEKDDEDAEFEAEYNGNRKINVKEVEKRLADEEQARIETKKKIKIENKALGSVPKKAWFGKKKGGVVR